MSLPGRPTLNLLARLDRAPAGPALAVGGGHPSGQHPDPAVAPALWPTQAAATRPAVRRWTTPMGLAAWLLLASFGVAAQAPQEAPPVAASQPDGVALEAASAPASAGASTEAGAGSSADAGASAQAGVPGADPGASAPLEPPAEPAGPATAASATPSVAQQAASAPPAAHPALQQADLVQPRAFGHVIGDVLTQRVRLAEGAPPPQGRALPPAGRVGTWFDRRAPRLERDDEGRDWVVIEHQVVNAPTALTTATLPAWAPLGLPAWPVSVGPLTPSEPDGRGALLALRPDRDVTLPSPAPAERLLRNSLVALAAVLAAWAGWWAWRNAREAVRLPFAQAERELARLGRGAGGSPLAARPEAWKVVHKALNAQAGRVLPHTELPQLLAEQPKLQPLRGQLEAFFVQSGARFFHTGGPDDAASAFPLAELVRSLRRIEKAH